jgi:hypothetical protein
MTEGAGGRSSRDGQRSEWRTAGGQRKLTILLKWLIWREGGIDMPRGRILIVDDNAQERKLDARSDDSTPFLPLCRNRRLALQ